jgi:hypothetical protein
MCDQNIDLKRIAPGEVLRNYILPLPLNYKSIVPNDSRQSATSNWIDAKWLNLRK